MIMVHIIYKQIYIWHYIIVLIVEMHTFPLYILMVTIFLWTVEKIVVAISALITTFTRLKNIKCCDALYNCGYVVSWQKDKFDAE